VIRKATGEGHDALGVTHVFKSGLFIRVEKKYRGKGSNQKTASKKKRKKKSTAV